MKKFVPYMILFAIVTASAGFGAALGGDARDAMKCQCDVGMVTYG